MSKQVSLQNTRPGGFGLPTGQVIPGNGSITVEPEVWKACKDHPVVSAKVEAGHLVVDGEPTAPASGDQDLAAILASAEHQRDKLQSANASLQTELDAAKARVAELEGAQGEGGSTAPLKAEHHGGGKFNVTQGESTLLSGLSKADADAFNAMDDAAKAAFITERKG